MCLLYVCYASDFVRFRQLFGKMVNIVDKAKTPLVRGFSLIILVEMRRIELLTS